MTHPDVTFDVKRRAAGKTERFHVGKHLRFVQSSVTPSPPETTDQFFIDWTPKVTQIHYYSTVHFIISYLKIIAAMSNYYNSDDYLLTFP